ncbi:hypothetical protein ABIA33_001134 [Streptacidiphilus sp. MAP12-16]|jgi:hypothetical protein|uniref:SCO4983 family protein n=1 Tax=Streptacidiphilus sp. MAP12-16 TaxID=3156300 RepID=UPI00351485ED
MYEQPKIVQARRRSLAHAYNSNAHNSSARSTTAPGAHGAQLAGHLAALRSATEAVRRATTGAAELTELDAALREIGARVTELSSANAPARSAASASASAKSLAELHDQAHALAGRLLVVAAAQQDTVTAMLACRRMDAHAAARRQLS